MPCLKGSRTERNLLKSFAGESRARHRYTFAAKVAREEGFREAATAFEMVARVEKEHEARFRKLLQNVKAGTVFRKEAPVRWKCRVCGHIHEGVEPPLTCPACAHAREYFEVAAENY